jgi:hypothetical protein
MIIMTQLHVQWGIFCSAEYLSCAKERVCTIKLVGLFLTVYSQLSGIMEGRGSTNHLEMLTSQSIAFSAQNIQTAHANVAFIILVIISSSL